MAPPRFQCLSAVKKVAKSGPSLRAAFSTSQTRTAGKSYAYGKHFNSNTSLDDIPPRRSGVSNDLLSSLDNKFSSNSTNTNASFSRTRDSNFMNTNPIGLPREKSPKIRNSTHNVYKLVAESAARRKQVAAAAQQTVPGSKSLGDAFLAQDYSKQITRRWRAGDIYAPHDLSGAEMKKWKRRSQPTHDVFDVLNFNPEQHYRVCPLFILDQGIIIS
jgi:small subunit ribosomal protein S18